MHDIYLKNAKNKQKILNKHKIFVFEKFEIDKKKNQARFYYSLDSKIKFTDVLYWHNKINWKKTDEELLNNALLNLHIIFGATYWKLSCPKRLVVKSGRLTREQIKFWEKSYTKGMGEFFYTNKINFKGLVRFISEGEKGYKVSNQQFRGKALLPLGGGKDSIVAGELLKKAKIDFDILISRSTALQQNVACVFNKKPIVFEHALASNFFKLNASGKYFKGHVPVTIFTSFISLLECAFNNYKYIVFANEHSANYGNVKYLGQTINHQYGKSLEFQKDMNKYIKKFMARDIEYFSLVSPIFEIQIAALFSKHKKYFNVFSSCNKNLRIDARKRIKKTWCGECPKCAFVFSLLYPFVSQKEIIKIFGKNLYEDKKLLNLYLELLGKSNIKPLECVGEPREVELAMYLACKKHFLPLRGADAGSGAAISCKINKLPYILGYWAKNNGKMENACLPAKQGKCLSAGEAGQMANKEIRRLEKMEKEVMNYFGDSVMPAQIRKAVFGK